MHNMKYMNYNKKELQLCGVSLKKSDTYKVLHSNGVTNSGFCI